MSSTSNEIGNKKLVGELLEFINNFSNKIKVEFAEITKISKKLYAVLEDPSKIDVTIDVAALKQQIGRAHV